MFLLNFVQEKHLVFSSELLMVSSYSIQRTELELSLMWTLYQSGILELQLL